jgi:hypothetical protein
VPRVDRGRASLRRATRRAVDLGTTVKPLDDGALTLRWTRAPARGLAVAPLAWSPPAATHSCARVGKKNAPGERVNGARVSVGEREGVLFRQDPRAAVDRDRTVTVVSAREWHLWPRRESEIAARAQVASTPSRERSRGGGKERAGRLVTGRCHWAAARARGPLHACGPVLMLGLAKRVGRLGCLQQKAQCTIF